MLNQSKSIILSGLAAATLSTSSAEAGIVGGGYGTGNPSNPNNIASYSKSRNGSVATEDTRRELKNGQLYWTEEHINECNDPTHRIDNWLKNLKPNEGDSLSTEVIKTSKMLGVFVGGTAVLALLTVGINLGLERMTGLHKK